MAEWVLIAGVVLYAVIGAFVMADVWSEFKISGGIRKLFRKVK